MEAVIYSESPDRNQETQPIVADNVSKALTDFESAVRRGETPRIEEYLAGIAPERRAALLKELLQLEAEHRRRAGHTPSRDEYVPRFQDFASVLDTVFPLYPSTVAPAEPADPHATQAFVADAGRSSAPTSAEDCGRFRIVKPHARGGLGEVFVAEDDELHRSVALKRIRGQFVGDADSRSRFVREAEITGNLEHPGIVPIYGLGKDKAGLPYYAMRFIQGESLKETIDRFHEPKRMWKDAGEKQLELRKLLQRFIDVCNAMEYAHSRGIVHRDLKPANIMVGKYGETLVVDWGLAKPIGQSETHDVAHISLVQLSGDSDSAPTQLGQAVGTPQYMSPEQAAGRHDELTGATDVYALGAVLYSILSGKPPIEGKTLGEVLQHVIQGKIAPLPAAVPGPLASICRKAMALEPSGRYSTSRALADDVEKWLADERVTAHRESFSERLGRWMRNHRAAVTGAAALTATGLVALIIGLISFDRIRTKNQERHNATRAEGLVNSLINADIGQVSSLVNNLDEYRIWADPLLKSKITETDENSSQRLYLALALLPVDPGQVNYLLEQLLVVTPQQLLVVRDALLPHKKAVSEKLWSLLEDQATDPDVRLRAAAALASYTPEDLRWKSVSGDIAGRLVVQNPLVFGIWTEALRPIAKFLLPSLATFLADDKRSASERYATAGLYRTYERNQVEALARLQNVLIEKTAESATADAKIDLAKRQANIGLALLIMGHLDDFWPLLRQGPDPTLRSFLIDRIAGSGIEAKLLLNRLEQEPDVSVRRALLLSLGNFKSDRFSEIERRGFQSKLLQVYRDDSDSGVHGAAEWSLRQWQALDDLPAIEKELATGKTKPDQKWHVNRQGQTMVIVPAPGEFWMGEGIARKKTRLASSFAIGSKEVTAEQFRRFRNENSAIRTLSSEQPVAFVSWYDAAAYCNWLSEQEGIPQDQWCYLPNKQGDYEAGMKPAPNHLQRTGYRLPTDAEWEYACRAGTDTGYSFGTAVELLDRYAWYLNNSTPSKSSSVARLKPNDLGLFDMHGNVTEWTQTEYLSQPSNSTTIGKTPGDQDDVPEQDEAVSRVQRGGAFQLVGSNARSFFRTGLVAKLRFGHHGFRTAKTLLP